MEFECQRCDVHWGGRNTMHCHNCGLVFTGLTAFEKHRDRLRNRCKTLAEAGLIKSSRRYECYGLPGDLDPKLFEDPDDDKEMD